MDLRNVPTKGFMVHTPLYWDYNSIWYMATNFMVYLVFKGGAERPASRTPWPSCGSGPQRPGRSLPGACR